MTLDEAIEKLIDETVQLRRGFTPGWIEAVKLGIEALKRLKTKRKLGIHYDQTLLPGETKEGE